MLRGWKALSIAVYCNSKESVAFLCCGYYVPEKQPLGAENNWSWCVWSGSALVLKLLVSVPSTQPSFVFRFKLSLEFYSTWSAQSCYFPWQLWLRAVNQKFAGSVSFVKCEPCWLLRNKKICTRGNSFSLCWTFGLKDHACSIKVTPFLKPLAFLWAGSPDLAECFNSITLQTSNKNHTLLDYGS